MLAVRAQKLAVPKAASRVRVAGDLRVPTQGYAGQTAMRIAAPVNAMPTVPAFPTATPAAMEPVQITAAEAGAAQAPAVHAAQTTPMVIAHPAKFASMVHAKTSTATIPF